MHRSFVRSLACLCLLLAGGLLAHAQTARFTGQVTDQQSAAIPNASVRLVNQDSAVKIETKTDATGMYTVPYLQAGRYRIEVEAPGFNQAMSNEINLGVGQAFLYNVQLAVGSTQSTVEVNGNSEVTQVNTQNAEVSGTITGKEVSGLQLNGREYTQFLNLVPGVSDQTGQDEAKVGVLGSVSYSVNGGRTEYNSFQVDGSETLNTGINKDKSSLIVYPSIDAIQEIKVLTSNYGAQYPSTGNATTIVTTKSGTDQLHGSLYEFLRNEFFNAKGYFDVGNKAPEYRRNDFGGTIGGPFYIPHLYDGRTKTHFFFSEETRLESSPTAYRQAVPSIAEFAGNFSDVCPFAPAGGVTVFTRSQYPDCPEAVGGETFPGNQLGVTENFFGSIPNKNSAALLSTGIIPEPNASSGCNSTIGSCYDAEVSLPTYYREELFRIDHTITSKMQASFRYIHDEWDTITPVPQFAFTQNSFPTIQNRFYGPGLSLVGRLTNTFTTSLLNEFVVSYTDSHIKLTDVPGAGVSLQRPPALDNPPTDCNPNDCDMAPIGSIFNNGYGGKLPGIVIAGTNAEYGGNGFAVDPGYMPWEHTNPVYSLADNLTKIHGKHTFQFGAQWVLFHRNQVNGPIGAATGDVQGLLTFSNTSASPHTTGNAFADFQVLQTLSEGENNSYNFGGRIASFQQDSGQGRYSQQYQIVEPYFQDDWKITPRFTINLGVRESLFGTFREANGKAYNWVPSAFHQLAQVDPLYGVLLGAGQTAFPTYFANGQIDPRVLPGIVQCGVNGVPNGCMTGHLFNTAPRIGLAWDPQGNGKSSIRAGYGIFFEHGTADEANTGSLEGGAPLVLSETQLQPFNWACIGDNNPLCLNEPDNGTSGINEPPNGVGASFPINVTAIPTKAVWPYIQQWSFSVERQVPKDLLVTVAYVGSKGTHLTLERELNQLLPATVNPFGLHQPFLQSICGQGAPPSYKLPNGTNVSATDPAYPNILAACLGANPNSLRQFAPGIGQIYSLENTANSSYNAFQATLRRTKGPLTAGVAYTYSHSIDNSSDRSDTTFVNSYDVQANRASSNFDQRHLLNASYIYDLPLLQLWRSFASEINSNPDPEDHSVPRKPPSAYGNSAAAKDLIGGWQLSGLTTFQTGIPFTVVNGGGGIGGASVLDNAGVANGVGAGSYPDLCGNPYGAKPAGGNNSQSFGPLLRNPGAFCAPTGLTFGTAGRNSLRNPVRLNFDMALLKHLVLPKEFGTLEFRAEVFNVFNNTQFRIYDPILGNQANNTVNCYATSADYGYSAAGGGSTNCLTGSSFLHPVDAHRPRTMQIALKLIF